MENQQEDIQQKPSGFHWQLMGSAAPDWIDGYETVKNWFVEHADSEQWDSLIAGMHETQTLFRGRSMQRIECDLKLNKAHATIKILHEKKLSPEFHGCQGFVLIFDKLTKEQVASRPFFAIMEEGQVVTVAMRAQIV